MTALEDITYTTGPSSPGLELRQAPLPKAHDPYQWTGWPLFELYGLTGDGGPSKRWTRTVSLPGDYIDK